MTTEELLQRARVASPCNANWDLMEGDERVRFCLSCNKHVYNFSAMSAEEVAALIRAREGRLCARFHRRRDGTMLTADCPVGRRRQRRRDLLGLCFGLLGAVAAFLGIAAASRNDSNSARLPNVIDRLESTVRSWFRPPIAGGIRVMGDIAVPPVPSSNPQPASCFEPPQ
jgi:hypothetical protein